MNDDAQRLLVKIGRILGFPNEDRSCSFRKRIEGFRERKLGNEKMEKKVFISLKKQRHFDRVLM